MYVEAGILSGSGWEELETVIHKPKPATGMKLTSFVLAYWQRSFKRLTKSAGRTLHFRNTPTGTVAQLCDTLHTLYNAQREDIVVLPHVQAPAV
jgi:hypothetical protein